jgi:hypothetical protein
MIITGVVSSNRRRGVAEVTQIQTLADVGGSLHQTKLLMHDRDGTVGIWLNNGALSEITTFDCTGLSGPALVAGENNPGKYLIFRNASGLSRGMWFQVNGQESEPDTGEVINVLVGLDGGDNDEDVAQALFGALGGGGGGFSIAGAVITFTDPNTGVSIDSQDFDSNVVITVVQQGRDNGSAPGGFDRTIEVTNVNGNTAGEVAAALQSALDADAAFSASVEDDIVTVTNTLTGVRTDATDVDTGFNITILTQGE